MHLLLRPNRRELALVLGAAAIFSVSYSLHHGTFVNFYGAVIAIPGGFLGMGSLLLVTMQWFWAPASASSFHRERALQVALIPALCVCSLAAVNLAAQVTPFTYDPLLYAFDLKFGGPPSWVIGKLLRAHPWLFQACGYTYNSLPLGLAICLAIQWRDRQKNLPIVVICAGFRLLWASPASRSIRCVQRRVRFTCSASNSRCRFPNLPVLRCSPFGCRRSLATACHRCMWAGHCYCSGTCAGAIGGWVYYRDVTCC